MKNELSELIANYNCFDLFWLNQVETFLKNGGFECSGLFLLLSDIKQNQPSNEGPVLLSFLQIINRNDYLCKRY